MFKKEAVVYYSFFFLSFIWTDSYAQELEPEVTVRHYQRKLTLDSIILPMQNYNSVIYSIPVPDSIYTAGILEIKNLTINNVKTSGVFYFNQNTYYKVEYVIKNNKKDILLNNYKVLKSVDAKNFRIQENPISTKKTRISFVIE